VIFIVWTGRAFWTIAILVGIPGVVSAATTLAISEEHLDRHPIYIGVGLLVAAAVNWWVGCRWNYRPLTEFGKPKGGGRWRRGPHRLFMLPMEYWSIPIAVWGILAIMSEFIR
jgi:hypothetical protein